MQQEADMKLRQSEVMMLQKELDGLTSTLTQLDTQKKEAQKRLDELNDKVSVCLCVSMCACVSLCVLFLEFSDNL